MRMVLSAAALLALAGCSLVDLGEDERGEMPAVTLLEGVARLPVGVEDGGLRVMLQDVSRADAAAKIVSEKSFSTSGRREVEYALPYNPRSIDPRHRYIVRAELRDGAGALRATTTTAYPALTGGASGPVDIALDPVKGAAADPWAAAKMRGVTFRGLGQEPGWIVEIAEGRRIVLTLDYGATTVTTPAPAPERTPGAMRYVVKTEANAFTVDIANTPCEDAMSGQAFPATVTLTLPGRTLQGCGQAL